MLASTGIKGLGFGYAPFAVLTGDRPQLTTLADGVVVWLNAAVFSEAFTAVRDVMPDYNLEELKTLKVTVVPVEVDYEPVSRETIIGVYSIDIGIQKKLVKTDINGQVEDLDKFVTEIVDYLSFRDIPDPIGYWIGTKQVPAYDRDHLVEMLVYTSVVTVKYKG